MFQYFWSDDTRTAIVRVDEVGNVTAYFPSDDGYDSATPKVSGVAEPIKDARLLTEDEVRKQRNNILADSDWTQVADAPVDQAAWATYRQSLRDIPQQDGFPTDVVWPDKP